jgi:hypothetical protein
MRKKQEIREIDETYAKPKTQHEKAAASVERSAEQVQSSLPHYLRLFLHVLFFLQAPRTHTVKRQVACSAQLIILAVFAWKITAADDATLEKRHLIHV